MAKIRETPPDLALLQRLLSYDPDTGILTWTNQAPANMRRRRAGSETARGYRVINIQKVPYYEHHVAWYLATGQWPSETIDHRDRNRANNKRKNLREATHQQNNQNSKIGQVYKKRSKWAAQLSHEGTSVYLGAFSCFGEAIKARNAKKRELHPYAEAYRK